MALSSQGRPVQVGTRYNHRQVQESRKKIKETAQEAVQKKERHPEQEETEEDSSIGS